MNFRKIGITALAILCGASVCPGAVRAEDASATPLGKLCTASWKAAD
jgi:hypothetical protein